MQHKSSAIELMKLNASSPKQTYLEYIGPSLAWLLLKKFLNRKTVFSSNTLKFIGNLTFQMFQ